MSCTESKIRKHIKSDQKKISRLLMLACHNYNCRLSEAEQSQKHGAMHNADILINAIEQSIRSRLSTVVVN